MQHEHPTSANQFDRSTEFIVVVYCPGLAKSSQEMKFWEECSEDFGDKFVWKSMKKLLIIVKSSLESRGIGIDDVVEIIRFIEIRVGGEVFGAEM